MKFFFTGTAVVVAPVGSICYNDKTVELGRSYTESITKNIRETLIDIQNENIKDPFGWVLPLD